MNNTLAGVKAGHNMKYSYEASIVFANRHMNLNNDSGYPLACV